MLSAAKTWAIPLKRLEENSRRKTLPNKMSLWTNIKILRRKVNHKQPWRKAILICPCTIILNKWWIRPAQTHTLWTRSINWLVRTIEVNKWWTNIITKHLLKKRRPSMKVMTNLTVKSTWMPWQRARLWPFKSKQMANKNSNLTKRVMQSHRTRKVTRMKTWLTLIILRI